jgi:DNA-binding GntR family transcriptional regulator
MKFEATKKELISEQVYQELRQMILSLSLKPGERIIEMEVAKKKGISQGPVREALQKLQQEGLVQTIRHTGTFVTELRSGDMWDIWHLRATVEGLAARRAAEKITDNELLNLETLVMDMIRSAEDENLQRLIELDMEFHQSVCAISENPVLVKTLQLIDSQVRRFITFTRGLFPNLHVIADCHNELITYLKNGDADGAEKAFRQHVEAIKNQMSNF